MVGAVLDKEPSQPNDIVLHGLDASLVVCIGAVLCSSGVQEECDALLHGPALLTEGLHPSLVVFQRPKQGRFGGHGGVHVLAQHVYQPADVVRLGLLVQEVPVRVREHLPVGLLDLCGHVLHVLTDGVFVHVGHVDLDDGHEIGTRARFRSSAPSRYANVATSLDRVLRAIEGEALAPAEARRLLHPALHQVRPHADLQLCMVEGIPEVDRLCVLSWHINPPSQSCMAIVCEARD
mmetsp:Transcript_62040/g.192284  ORF Transcript_62040/g.192284 Transcript_62040/m.192284 type:complete len:235 (+) Transcript_62040:327-1031(+)